MISMQELRQAVSMGAELRLMQAEASIKSRTIDQAIILADDKEIQTVSAKALAYQLNGINAETIAALLVAEAAQASLKAMVKQSEALLPV